MKNRNLITLLLAGMISTTTLFATDYTYGLKDRDSYAEFDYQEEMSSQMNKTFKSIKKLKEKNRESYITARNATINEIQEKQRVKFVLKDYKKMDVFVREDFAIIDSDYVLKNPSGWRRVLIKETNIWE